MKDITHWTTQEGEQLEIKNMKTSHIENCIKMLERQISQINSAERSVKSFGVPNNELEFISFTDHLEDLEQKRWLREGYIKAFNTELESRKEE